MPSDSEDSKEHDMGVDSDDDEMRAEEMEAEPEPELTPAEHKAKGNEFYKKGARNRSARTDHSPVSKSAYI